MSIQLKQVTSGTHRAIDPVETWKRILPVFSRVGITRVADMTALDVVGIPVFQAVRPNARSLAVSQGKGITPGLARVSAAMESIEVWHAEQHLLSGRQASVAEMREHLVYSPFDLPLAPRSILSNSTRLCWLPARTLSTDEYTWLPEDCVRVDATDPFSWQSPLFSCSSNGLASGNSLQEALLHAAYELLERHARSVYRETPVYIDPASVTGVASDLITKYQNAEVALRIEDISRGANLPCYEVLIWSREHPVCFGGWGCHRDADVALCRALTEAAQARVTTIAGARDDIPDEAYTELRQRLSLRNPLKLRGEQHAFENVHSYADTSLEDDLAEVVQLLSTRSGNSACWVDLTHPDLGIPVVRVIAPGLDMPRGHA
jgi:ribosomal protein S12 methylthiotransferase accessory factor